MISSDTSHYPSADDITFDSLEYLFGSASSDAKSPIPWVEIESVSQKAEQQANEYERKFAVLGEQLQQNARQLQRMCIFIGYMQGLLQEKDNELKALPDLRFKAGLAVARGLEAERYKEKIRELEEVIQRLNHHSNPKPEEMFRTLISSLNSDEVAISILMWLGFIGLSGVLATIVLGF